MSQFSISIKTENAYIVQTLVHILKANFILFPYCKITINDKELSDKDLVFYEVAPGEIYLCNSNFAKLKRGSILFILHSYSKNHIVREERTCLQDAIYFSIKENTIQELSYNISGLLKTWHAANTKPSTRNDKSKCQCKKLTNKQTKIAGQLSKGMDLLEISRKNEVSVKTIKHHIKNIMEKFNLKNINELYQFINALCF